MTLIFEKLLALGVSYIHAVAITANIAVETDCRFDAALAQYNNGPGMGLLQFEPYPGLGGSLRAYSDLTGCGLESADCQLEWLVDSLYGTYEDGRNYIGPGNVDRFTQTTTVAEATRVFSESILRPGKPHMDKRLEAARDLHESRGRHYCQYRDAHGVSGALSPTPVQSVLGWPWWS
jgi:hypothetical protein